MSSCVQLLQWRNRDPFGFLERESKKHNTETKKSETICVLEKPSQRNRGTHILYLSLLLFSRMCFVIVHGSLRFSSPVTIDLSTPISLWDLSFHKWWEFFAFFKSQVSTLRFSILTACVREKVFVLKRLGCWVRKIWKQWRREGMLFLGELINEIV